MSTTNDKKFKKMFSRIHVTSITIMLFLSIKIVNTQQCSNFAIQKQNIGHRLEGHVILTTTEESIGTCVKKCFQLTHCLSINFDTVSQSCDLNNISINEQLTNIVQNATSVLSDISAWPKVSDFIYNIIIVTDLFC